MAVAFLGAVALARVVLTTDGLVVTRLNTGVGPGSDHRPLVAEVAVVGRHAS